MKPEAKAIDLIFQFSKAAGCYINELVFGIAKRSALQCTHEIIECLQKCDSIDLSQENDFQLSGLTLEDYWRMVQNHLQKLTIEHLLKME